MTPELIGNIILQLLIAFNSAPQEQKDRFWQKIETWQARLDNLTGQKTN